MENKEISNEKEGDEYKAWFLEPFPHYRIPQALFKDPFTNLSAEAKLIYGILLSRTTLSYKNDRVIEGAYYSFFKISEIEKMIGCGHDKASKLLGELEDYQLLRRKRQYLGKPTCMFLCDFKQQCENSADWCAKDPHTGMRNIGITDCEKAAIK